MLTSSDDVPLWRAHPDRFAGAIAPDGAACDAWEEQLDPLPVGIALDCPPVPDEEDENVERPVTLFYIRQCKEAFRDRLHEDAAFYYLRNAATSADAQSLRSLRWRTTRGICRTARTSAPPSAFSSASA